VLTAAWLGVSERELTRAVAKEARLEFIERPPRIDVSGLVGNKKAVLDQCREVGVIPVFQGPVLESFVVVDPAEVRSLTLYTGKEKIALGCWTDLSRVLDEAVKTVQEEYEESEQRTTQKQDELCRKVVDTLLQEALAHQAAGLEIVTVDGGTRYQFVTPDGRRGRGTVHRGIVPHLCRYLSRHEGHVVKYREAGDVFVRSMGSLSDYKLTWKARSELIQDATDRESLLGLPGPIQEIAKVTRDTIQHVNNQDDLVAIHQQTPSELPQTIEGVSTRVGGDKSNSPHGDPILVVDDNGMFCRVLEKLLRRDGYSPLFAENGVVGLEKLSQSEHYLPIAIVCDLHMPRMNGKEFVSTVRKNERLKHIPIIMLTSDEDIDVEVELLNLGADAFVSKSKDPRILAAQIKRVSRERNQRVAA
jgi:CheY-like chemotaxis protein